MIPKAPRVPRGMLGVLAARPLPNPLPVGEGAGARNKCPSKVANLAGHLRESWMPGRWNVRTEAERKGAERRRAPKVARFPREMLGVLAARALSPTLSQCERGQEREARAGRRWPSSKGNVRRLGGVPSPHPSQWERGREREARVGRRWPTWRGIFGKVRGRGDGAYAPKQSAREQSGAERQRWSGSEGNVGRLGGAPSPQPSPSGRGGQAPSAKGGQLPRGMLGVLAVRPLPNPLPVGEGAGARSESRSKMAKLAGHLRESSMPWRWSVCTEAERNGAERRRAPKAPRFRGESWAPWRCASPQPSPSGRGSRSEKREPVEDGQVGRVSSGKLAPR